MNCAVLGDRIWSPLSLTVSSTGTRSSLSGTSPEASSSASPAYSRSQPLPSDLHCGDERGLDPDPGLLGGQHGGQPVAGYHVDHRDRAPSPQPGEVGEIVDIDLAGDQLHPLRSRRPAAPLTQLRQAGQMHAAVSTRSTVASATNSRPSRNPDGPACDVTGRPGPTPRSAQRLRPPPGPATRAVPQPTGAGCRVPKGLHRSGRLPGQHPGMIKVEPAARTY